MCKVTKKLPDDCNVNTVGEAGLNMPLGLFVADGVIHDAVPVTPTAWFGRIALAAT